MCSRASASSKRSTASTPLLDHGIAVSNGVLAVERFEDAEARAGGAHGNKGEEAALAALEMTHLWEQLA